jgi:hypothetical protein
MAFVTKTTTQMGGITTHTVTSSTFEPWPAKVFTHTRLTNVTPAYFTKISKGEWIPPLAYQIQRELKCYPVGSMAQWREQSGVPLTREILWEGILDQPYQGKDVPSLPSLLSLTASELSAATSRLTAKTLSKVKNSDVNLAVMWGERRQTVSLIASTVSRMAGIATMVRRGNWSGAMHAMGLPTETRKARRSKAKFDAMFKISPQQAFANFWLEWNYGWKPFIQDIYGSMAAFAKPMPDPLVQVKSFVNETRQDRIARDDFWARSVMVRKLSHRIGHIIYWRLADGAAAAMTRTAAQLGLTNPLYVIYELTPFSFVLDWIFPVGNYLESLDATYGTTFHSGCSITRVTRTSSLTVSGGGRKPTSTVWWEGGSEASSGDDSFARSVLGAFPTPMLPAIKDPLSVSHALSALSLLQQIFRF